MSKPEPLKGKKINKGIKIIGENYFWFHPEDIRSAVEWLLTEVISCSRNDKNRSKDVSYLIKEAFEDVMKDE